MLLLLRRSVTFVLVVVTSSAVFGGLAWLAPGQRAADDAPDSYVGWLIAFWRGVLTLDLGRSYRGIPVLEMVVRGAERSLPLVLGALLLSLVAGLLLAFALPEGRTRAGRLLRVAGHLASLCPVFLLGYLALVVFAVPPEGPQQTIFAVAILAIGDGMFSDVLLGIDDELRRLRARDFVQSARLRGTPLWRHYAPHLAVPLLRLAAARLAWLMGGVLVLEMVLGIQGLGLIGYRAADAADFPLLVAITVFVTALVAGAHLAVDFAQVLLDPRLRKERAEVAP